MTLGSIKYKINTLSITDQTLQYRLSGCFGVGWGGGCIRCNSIAMAYLDTSVAIRSNGGGGISLIGLGHTHTHTLIKFITVFQMSAGLIA